MTEAGGPGPNLRESASGDTDGRPRRLWPSALAKAAAVAVALVAIVAISRGACGRSLLPPIRQKGAWLVVENQTKAPWKDVSVTLNSYYRGVSPTLAPGGRLEAPLANFVTGLGQRFNTAREQIRRVEVRATDATGNPVVLDWDETTGPPLVQEGRDR
jgi:hypothetical protein